MASQLAFYREMLRIREFESALLRLSQDGILRGSLHLARGQEALPVGICSALSKTDYLTVTYRGHGYALAKGCDLRAILAEILGRESGLCHGYGGKMHLIDLPNGLLGANGIVGAGVPIAAGAALASKIDKQNKVACTIFGDGALNQGVVMETLNMASLLKLPLILVCENNYYSEMTPLDRSTAVTSLVEKARGFGISSFRVDGNNVQEVHSLALQAVQATRGGGGPVFIGALTYRLSGHYQLDPGTSYRSSEEIRSWQDRDPIEMFARVAAIDAKSIANILKEIKAELDSAIAWAFGQAEPDPAELMQKVFC